MDQKEQITPFKQKAMFKADGKEYAYARIPMKRIDALTEKLLTVDILTVKIRVFDDSDASYREADELLQQLCGEFLENYKNDLSLGDLTAEEFKEIKESFFTKGLGITQRQFDAFLTATASLQAKRGLTSQSRQETK